MPHHGRMVCDFSPDLTEIVPPQVSRRDSALSSAEGSPNSPAFFTVAETPSAVQYDFTDSSPEAGKRVQAKSPGPMTCGDQPEFTGQPWRARNTSAVNGSKAPTARARHAG